MDFGNKPMTSFKTLFIAAAALTLCACNSNEALSPKALISTAQGPVQGVTTKSPDIYNFKGIPYTQAPIGEARWPRQNQRPDGPQL